jgi:hypothetical protein
MGTQTLPHQTRAISPAHAETDARRVEASRAVADAQSISAEHRRALELLVTAGPVGFPHALLLDHGVTRKLLTEMVRGGQAITVTSKVRAGHRPGRKNVRFSYVRITDTGHALLIKSVSKRPEHA